MAYSSEEANYWTDRAEKELQLSRQCSAEAANAHRVRASHFRDLAHQAIRSTSGRFA